MNIEKLKKKISYDPETGLFTRVKNGTVVKTKFPNGYLFYKFEGKSHLLHRLAWLYVYGSHPEKNIDHINRIKDDNRICNLRDVSQSENMYNKDRGDLDKFIKNIPTSAKTWNLINNTFV